MGCKSLKLSLFGIVILVKLLQLQNAKSPIPAVLERKFTEETEVSQDITHLSTYCTPFSVCISLSHPLNAELSMLVMLARYSYAR